MTFTYNGSYTPVFEEATFNLNTAWKLGFTGRNGRGKTTFLRLLQGLGPKLGTLTGRIDTTTVVDYFPFDIPRDHMSQLTYQIVDSINPNYQHWELVRELNLLDLEEAVLYRPFETLSHGERTKVQLAVLFLKQDHFLMIDEPTNHLDVKGRACVSGYLNKKRGFILVSHDRVFLDGCIDHVLSINKSKIEIHMGNFSTYMENKSRQDAFELAENAKLTASIRTLGEAAKRTGAWSDDVEATKYMRNNHVDSGMIDRGHIGAKSAKLMKRAKAIETRRNRAIAEKETLLHDIESQHPLELKVNIPTAPYRAGEDGKAMVTVTNLWASYGGDGGGGGVDEGQDEGESESQGPIIDDLSFAIYHGDRVAITGGNGSGKSTLLKILANPKDGGPLTTRGRVALDPTHTISYVSQDTSGLTATLRDFIAERKLDEGLFKSMLHKLDFSTEQFDKPMSAFSAGQKKKVLLAASICDRAHIYIWDEPLNYIDVISRMQIEDMILKYQPTLIFVEHDQAFVGRVATRHIDLK